MQSKITTVTIPIPYKSAGGVIRQQQTSFELFQADGHYSLRPCLNAEELRLANLPEELRFTLQHGKPVSMRGTKDGNFHVIQDAVIALQSQNHLTE